MIDRDELPEDLQHLSRGCLLGALDIDPTHNPQPTRPGWESLRLLAEQVEAERNQREAS